MFNFPPGHPTGVSRGEPGTGVFHCEPCYRLWATEDRDALKLRLQVKHGRTPTCPDCNHPLERAECEHWDRETHAACGQPATHIDIDRSVNCPGTYCDHHSMR
jgi:hypothetical protein